MKNTNPKNQANRRKLILDKFARILDIMERTSGEAKRKKDYKTIEDIEDLVSFLSKDQPLFNLLFRTLINRLNCYECNNCENPAHIRGCRNTNCRNWKGRFGINMGYLGKLDNPEIDYWFNLYDFEYSGSDEDFLGLDKIE